MPRPQSIALASLSVPCVIGSVLLYTLPRDTKGQQVGNLISYYLLAFLFAANPLLVRSVTSPYFCASLSAYIKADLVPFTPSSCL